MVAVCGLWVSIERTIPDECGGHADMGSRLLWPRSWGRPKQGQRRHGEMNGPSCRYGGEEVQGEERSGESAWEGRAC